MAWSIQTTLPRRCLDFDLSRHVVRILKAGNCNVTALPRFRIGR